MAVRVNTNTLMKRLFKAENLDSYLLGNERYLQMPDFYKMLKAGPLNKVIKEQYRMENGKMEIELSGIKKTDTNLKILDAAAKRVR